MDHQDPVSGGRPRHSALMRVGGWGLACVAVCVGVLLRLPAMAEPLGIDQGIFSTFAVGLREGLGPYVGVWDQKPPGIHLLYTAAFDVLSPATRTVFWLDVFGWAVTGLGVTLLAGRLAGRVTAAWTISVYALLTLPYLRYSYGGFLERAVPEVFINAAVALAAYLATFALQRLYVAVLAGLFIGIAIVLKPWAFIFWPLIVALFDPKTTTIAPRVRPALWSLAGAAVPPIAVLVWLASAGALGEARAAIVDYNRVYLGLGTMPLVFIDRFAHHVWLLTKTDPLWGLGMAAGLVGTVSTIVRRRLETDWFAGAIWLTIAVIGAAASGVRLYTTYFIPCLPPLALLGGWLLAWGARAPTRSRLALVWAIVLLVLGRAIWIGLPQRVASAVALDVEALDLAPGSPDHLRYLERFGGYATGRGYSARANYELTDYVRRHTTPGDRVFIFGMAPVVYFESERLPANRFVWIGPAVGGLLRHPGFSLDELAADLARAAPTLLIRERNNRDSIVGWRSEQLFAGPAMQQVLRDYRLEQEIEDFSVYRRTNGESTGDPAPSGPAPSAAAPSPREGM